MDDLFDIFKTIVIMVVCCVAFILMLVTPIVYLGGKAKSVWLEHQNIEMPWYRAAFLDVTINANNISGSIAVNKGE